MKKYTVILLYPDFLASNYGQEIYTAWVEGMNPDHAIAKAELEASSDNFHEAGPGDWYCLACFQGHIKNLKP